MHSLFDGNRYITIIQTVQQTILLQIIATV